MAINFYETIMGKRFFEGTAPKLARETERLADAIECLNMLKEREIKCQERLLEMYEEQKEAMRGFEGGVRW